MVGRFPSTDTSKLHMNPKSPGKQIQICFAAAPVSRTNPAMIASSLILRTGSCLPDLYLSSSPALMTHSILGHLFSHASHPLDHPQLKRRIWGCFVCVLTLVGLLSLWMLAQSFEVLSWLQPLRRMTITLFLISLMVIFSCVCRRPGKRKEYITSNS